jgi:hypothetical protein
VIDLRNGLFIPVHVRFKFLTWSMYRYEEITWVNTSSRLSGNNIVFISCCSIPVGLVKKFCVMFHFLRDNCIIFSNFNMKKANWVETQLALVCLLNMTLPILFYILTELHVVSPHLDVVPLPCTSTGLHSRELQPVSHHLDVVSILVPEPVSIRENYSR